jgi:hypothetical protein
MSNPIRAEAVERLLPCPFCGCPDIEYDIICIDCPNCLASGPARRAVGDDGVLTSEGQWNKRRPSAALEAGSGDGGLTKRQQHLQKWPNGDAGDAVDFACDHAKEPLFFLEDWRKDGAREWPDYRRWLKVQYDPTALSRSDGMGG